MGDCRMYENIYPEVDDLVIVMIKRIAEMGAYCELLEYNNHEGMILLSELSRRRIRSISRLIKVGKIMVVVVLRVDKEKGYVDLSKRRVTPEDVVKFEEKYNKSKTVHSILRHVAEKREMKLEDLYKKVGWPLYKKYGHAHDALKMALQDPERILGEFKLEKDLMDDLMSGITRRLTPVPVKIRSIVSVQCFNHHGVDAIISSLNTALVASGSHDLKIKLVAPPNFDFTINSTEKQDSVKAIEKAIDACKKAMEEFKGIVEVVQAPSVVSEKDDKLFSQYLEDLERQNKEVSGDDDVSDSEEDD